MTANERDSGVDVVHGWFPKSGDKRYLLGAIASEADEFLWLANRQSHIISQDVQMRPSALSRALT